MNKIYILSLESNNVEWDKDYVRNKYAIQISNCDVLYYPSRNPKRLVVNFSSMGKDRFDRYSRYWDKTEKWEVDTAYVFFKDDIFSYYLGDDNHAKKSTYIRLIKQFMSMNNLTSNHVYTVGGSMGGLRYVST